MNDGGILILLTYHNGSLLLLLLGAAREIPVDIPSFPPFLLAEASASLGVGLHIKSDGSSRIIGSKL